MIGCHVPDTRRAKIDDVPQWIVFDGQIGNHTVNPFTNKLGQRYIALARQRTQRIDLIWPQVNL